MHIITTHENANFDGFASMVAAHKLFPKATLVFPGSQEEYLREFIAQSLTYEYDFHTTDTVDLKSITRLTLVDTQSSKELGKIKKCLTNNDLQIDIFDHRLDTKGDLLTQDATTGHFETCTTLFVKIFQEKNITISPEEATILALGIYGDTDSLTHPNTTADDIYAAGWLVENGAKLNVVSHFFQAVPGIAHEQILHEMSQSADKFIIQRFPVTIASLTLPRYVSDLAYVSKQFSEIENLDSLFVLAATDNRIHLIALSRIADINVGVIARDLGGGGHATSASATLSGVTLSEVEEQLVNLLHLHIQPQPTAAEMMSSPVISIGPEIALKVANSTLTRYNVTDLPVVDKETEKVVGIISRQVIEKALYHNLGHLSVSSYMSTEIETLPKDAQLADIQALIIEHKQRLIPILDNETKLIGIVTRTDLLNRLVNDPANLPKNLHQETNKPSLVLKRNLNSLIVTTLDREMILLLRNIGEIADEVGFNAFAVGGFVRDLLQKRANKDLDIVVEGNGIVFAKKITERLGGKYLAHDKYITAIITLPNGFKVDIATARLEYYEAPASMPMIELSSIKLDLFRRDFTINAMALQINAQHFGTLVDYFNCQNDLKLKKIKVLHNLSFVEDPSRIFRAVRFETRMQFKISEHTKRLIENAVTMNVFGKARDVRFLAELKIIFEEKNPVLPLLRLAEFQFFQYLWPDLRPSYRVNRRFVHTLNQTKAAIEQFKEKQPKAKLEKWQVYLLAVFHSSGIEELQAFCTRFSENKKHANTLVNTKKVSDDLLAKLYPQQDIKPSELSQLLEEHSNESLIYMIGIARKSWIKKAITDYLTHLRDLKPHTTGKDLAAMGYKPGPRFREILSMLRFAQMDGLAQTKEDELHLIEENFPLDA